MTKESGLQPPQTEPAADTDQAAGAGSQLTDAAQLGARHHYDVALDLWYGRKSQESEALDKAAAEHYAALVRALMNAFTPEERAALDNCLVGDGSPLEAAKLLRHRPEIVETWPLPDTESVRMIRGLVRLSNPNAFALVESGRVPVDQAALVGHCVRNVFAHHHPPQVCEDFQMRAMTRLAEGKPVSAERAKYFANPIEEVASDVLNEQKAERRRLDCERIWNEPYWSVWNVLSWIAFRDVPWLCEIEDEGSFAGVKSYGVKHYGPSLKQAAPESLLLAALKNDELKAIRRGAELQAIYWTDKIRVDRNTWFRQKSVRRCWPGPGEVNGFQDEFWSLGQIIHWIVTRDPDEVDQASDDAGRTGGMYGGLAAGVRIHELLREQREQVQDAATDLRRRCLRGELKALSQRDLIPTTAWIDLKIDFDEGVPFVRRVGQRTRDPAYDNIRFSRDETLRVFRPAETSGDIEDLVADAKGLSLRRQWRTRRADRFNRKQERIAFEKRVWLRLTEIADEYARKSGSLTIEDEKREQFLDELRRSILAGEFLDDQGRSRVLNRHPSELADFRFDPLSARHAELFNPIARHLWIRRQDCVDWFNRHKLDLPLRLRQQHSSTSRPDVTDVERAKIQPPKKSDKDKEADAIDSAKTFVVDGVAPSVKEHATAIMGVLKKQHPQNHIRREDLERLLATEFKAQRRPQGNSRRT